MSDNSKATCRIDRFDRPNKHMAIKDAAQAPWTSGACCGDKDKAGHCRYQ